MYCIYNNVKIQLYIQIKVVVRIYRILYGYKWNYVFTKEEKSKKLVIWMIKMLSKTTLKCEKLIVRQRSTNCSSEGGMICQTDDRIRPSIRARSLMPTLRTPLWVHSWFIPEKYQKLSRCRSNVVVQLKP